MKTTATRGIRVGLLIEMPMSSKNTISFLCLYISNLGPPLYLNWNERGLKLAVHES
uniref:Uncharacterized protein n=1 Tax=Rhizophora mucronata TaxID=61149 RepID=A0A2P2NNR2_RHIMU